MSRIAYLSTYIPKRCGLATYTHHLRQSVRAAKGWRGIDPVLVVTDERDDTAAPDPALWPLPKHAKSAYVKAADKINRSDVAVVSLQHEFGIFGGEAGDYALAFLERVRKPVVTTFHTVFEHPQEPYASIQKQIAERSERIVVMNRQAVRFLSEAFAIPKEKIRFIPHGAPVPVPGKREEMRRKLGWTDRKVIMTFGLLSRGKGLETILRALPGVVREVPETLYAIVGQTHPEVKKREGEAYRQQLRELIRSEGLERNVVMIDRYVEEDELIGFLSACDLYVTPYPGVQQITSGTLAYAVGLGRPVLSTPYAYAKDLLGDDSTLLIPFEDVAGWQSRMTAMLGDAERLRSCERLIASIGAGMAWPQIGRLYLQLFEETIRSEELYGRVLKA
jgi:glycosyltransferase involved in cell wall biosynthesis